MGQDATYSDCLANSRRIAWTIDEVLQGRKLDFTRRFLPESLARSEALDFLTADERRVHNQIRGHGYLVTFGLVEEFILPFLVDHEQQPLPDGVGADPERAAALANFADEEAKHIELFRRFQTLFEEGFGQACPCIGPPEAIAEHVLSQPALGVALMILHIEWMTLDHYVASVKDDTDLDPMFRDLLRYHWQEESQHARMDWLVVQELAAQLGPEEIDEGFRAYHGLLAFFDAGMRSQAELDLASMKEATTRDWTEVEENAYLEQQHAALRWTYVQSGMLNSTFLELTEELRAGAADELRRIAAEMDAKPSLTAAA